jgi:hypothetical protein
MEQRIEPMTHEEKMRVIYDTLKNIGYTVLDYKTGIKENGFLPSGIIDLKIIPSRLFL